MVKMAKFQKINRDKTAETKGNERAVFVKKTDGSAVSERATMLMMLVADHEHTLGK